MPMPMSMPSVGIDSGTAAARTVTRARRRDRTPCGRSNLRSVPSPTHSSPTAAARSACPDTLVAVSPLGVV
jgi:hypothetical protein